MENKVIGIQRVTHNVFGHGEVTGREITENNIYFTVKFDSGKVSRFALESFESGFVTAEGSLADEVDVALREKLERETERRNAERALRRLEAARPTQRTHGTRTRTRRTAATTAPGPIEEAFEEYLIKEGYKVETDSGNPSTVYSYINGVNTVLEEEGISWTVLKRDIGDIIEMYDEDGIKSDIGNKSNKTVINALRRFEEFVNP